MFSYIDPTIQHKLISDGRLVSIDETGAVCGPDEAAAQCPFISVLGPVPLPIEIGGATATFRWYVWVRHTDLDRIQGVVSQVRAQGPKMLFALLADHMAVNSALLLGDFEHAPSPMVRIHSNCLTGDVFGSQRCDCGPQLREALRLIASDGAGALLYMAGHEGRGIGLWAKAITYLLQDSGNDTYQANQQLGLPEDSRDFSDAGRMLVHFRGRDRSIRLIGNNPLKRVAVEGAGVRVSSQQPLIAGVTRYNKRYLESKRQHGHTIPSAAIGGHDDDRGTGTDCCRCRKP